jgi:enoyl-CoA hydratase/carnithine racemase
MAATPKVTYTRTDDVVTITLDDGKMNSFDLPLVAELNAALDRAEAESGTIAVLLVGNAKAFSAGFNLKVRA